MTDEPSSLPHTEDPQLKTRGRLSPTAILVGGMVIGFVVARFLGSNFLSGISAPRSLSSLSGTSGDSLPSFSEDVTLPVQWGDLGQQLEKSGVLDAAALEKLYESRGGIDADSKKLLYGDKNGNLVISQKNSGFLLNLLWALGLGNENPILENGPMQDKQYGGAGRFASTGGWTLAKGDAMEHYSKHNFIVLTSAQQTLVEKVSKGIYRPCCGNSTYFPDCNHGMAMLGLLELMAAQGKSETEMYQTALLVNSYWFPDTYRNIAKYFSTKGVRWADVDPKETLGSEYSSGAGYSQLLSKIEPEKSSGGGGCGV